MEEKDDVNGEGEVLFGRPNVSSEDEGRSVDNGVSPRRALVPGAGKPQADCWPLTDCATELLFELEAIDF